LHGTNSQVVLTIKFSKMKNLNIVVLSAAPNSSATKSIIKAGEKRGHKMIVLDPSYLYLLISDSVNGYDRVFDGYDQDNKPIRIAAKDIDSVISRIGNNLSYGASVLHHFKYNLGIFCTQSPSGILTASDKLLSLQKVSAAGIRVPKTIIADNAVHINWMIEQIGGLPAICKTLFGSQGLGVIYLESKMQTNATLESFYKHKIKILLQQFVDGNSKDIRAIVIGGKVVVAMERTAPENDIRSNISRGGTGRKITLSADDQEIAINAARACGLEVAGVDIMKDSNGKTYIIEVNGNYGYHVETVTDTDISTPLIMYCENNYKTKSEGSNHTSMIADDTINLLVDMKYEVNKSTGQRLKPKDQIKNEILSFVDENESFSENLGRVMMALNVNNLY